MKYFFVAIRVVWFFLSLLILYFTLVRASQLQSMRDISELIGVMSFAMIIISFPTGVFFLFLLFIVDLIREGFCFAIEDKFISVIFIWFCFVLGGLTQWFLLLGVVFKRIKADSCQEGSCECK